MEPDFKKQKGRNDIPRCPLCYQEIEASIEFDLNPIHIRNGFCPRVADDYFHFNSIGPWNILGPAYFGHFQLPNPVVNVLLFGERNSSPKYPRPDIKFVQFVFFVRYLTRVLGQKVCLYVDKFKLSDQFFANSLWNNGILTVVPTDFHQSSTHKNLVQGVGTFYGTTKQAEEAFTQLQIDQIVKGTKRPGYLHIVYLQDQQLLSLKKSMQDFKRVGETSTIDGSDSVLVNISSILPSVRLNETLYSYFLSTVQPPKPIRTFQPPKPSPLSQKVVTVKAQKFYFHSVFFKGSEYRFALEDSHMDEEILHLDGTQIGVRNNECLTIFLQIPTAILPVLKNIAVWAACRVLILNEPRPGVRMAGFLGIEVNGEYESIGKIGNPNDKLDLAEFNLEDTSYLSLADSILMENYCSNQAMLTLINAKNRTWIEFDELKKTPFFVAIPYQYKLEKSCLTIVEPDSESIKVFFQSLRGKRIELMDFYAISRDLLYLCRLVQAPSADLHVLLYNFMSRCWLKGANLEPYADVYPSLENKDFPTLINFRKVFDLLVYPCAMEALAFYNSELEKLFISHRPIHYFNPTLQLLVMCLERFFGGAKRSNLIKEKITEGDEKKMIEIYKFVIKQSTAYFLKYYVAEFLFAVNPSSLDDASLFPTILDAVAILPPNPPILDAVAILPRNPSILDETKAHMQTLKREVMQCIEADTPIDDKLDEMILIMKEFEQPYLNNADTHNFLFHWIKIHRDKFNDFSDQPLTRVHDIARRIVPDVIKHLFENLPLHSVDPAGKTLEKLFVLHFNAMKHQHYMREVQNCMVDFDNANDRDGDYKEFKVEPWLGAYLWNILCVFLVHKQSPMHVDELGELIQDIEESKQKVKTIDFPLFTYLNVIQTNFKNGIESS